MGLVGLGRKTVHPKKTDEVKLNPLSTVCANGLGGWRAGGYLRFAVVLIRNSDLFPYINLIRIMEE